MLFSNVALQGRSMRTEQMLYVSGEGEATVARIQSIQMVAAGDKWTLPVSSPRR